MSYILAPVGGVAVLAALVSGGAMTGADLAHPFWQARASVTGGAIGAVLAIGLVWLAARRPGSLRIVSAGALLALPASLAVTWRAARTFIDSADFEPLAGRVWFLGYHAVAALVVLGAALAIIALRRRVVRRA